MKEDTFLSWVAGFFDGEGCVTVLRKKTGESCNHKLFVSITQQDNRALLKIRERFGGAVLLDRNKGKDTGYKRHMVWRWKVTGPVAYQFLHNIAPYCMVKDKQIALALEWPLETFKGRPVPGHIWKKRNDIMEALRAERASVKEPVDA